MRPSDNPALDVINLQFGTSMLSGLTSNVSSASREFQNDKCTLPALLRAHVSSGLLVVQSHAKDTEPILGTAHSSLQHQEKLNENAFFKM